MIRLLILPLLFISFKLQASENKELSFYKTSSNVFTHEFDTNLVFFKNGAWYKDEVLANMEKLYTHKPGEIPNLKTKT